MSEIRKLNKNLSKQTGTIACSSVSNESKYEKIFHGKYENNFQQVSQIGEGAFGEVFEVKQNITDYVFAIKIVEIKNNLDLNEIKILSKLDTDFVVKFVDSWIEEKGLFHKIKRYLFIQMEFCSMNLRDFIDLLKPITNESLQTFNYFISFKIFKELIECVNYLHSLKPPLIHRDLKPENILISEGINGRLLKLCDFGFAKVHQISVHTKRVGTPKYMAPEVMKSKNYNTKSDIYSLALIGTEIFLFEDEIEIIRGLKTFRDFNKYQSKFLNTILEGKFKQLLQLLSNCLLPKDYHMRPDCKHLLERIYYSFLDIVNGDKYTMKAIENFKKIFVGSTLKCSGETKYFCQRFESFYREVENNLNLNRNVNLNNLNRNTNGMDFGLLNTTFDENDTSRKITSAILSYFSEQNTIDFWKNFDKQN